MERKPAEFTGLPIPPGAGARVGVAMRLPKQTVVRAGYGMNYTVGQYGSFASTMALQPMVNQPSFVNEQTNEAVKAGQSTLANGFPSIPTTVTTGSYAVDPHYRLPYVQAWNLDVQKTLPWGVVLNAGYNGSKSSRLDVTSSPRRSLSSPTTNYNPPPDCRLPSSATNSRRLLRGSTRARCG